MSITKILPVEIPTSLIVVIRTFFGLVFFIPFLIKNKHQALKTKKLSIHLSRITTTVLAMLCTYYTYRHLPLSVATSLGMTGPLFTTLISILFLKEKISRYKWIFLITGYLGTLFIIQPHNMVIETAIFTGLLANVSAGSATVLVKHLSTYDSTITIMGYGNLGVFLVALLLNYNGWQTISLKNIGLMAVISMLGLLTQYCSITALKLTNPSFTAPFEYIRLLFSILIGIMVFSEHPNSYTLIGSVVVIVSTYMITPYKNFNTIK